MVNDFSKINNQQYHLYRIENEYLIAEITDFGATLVEFKRKDQNINIVLRNEDALDYLKNISEAKGATVGRVANRIAKGSYFIDDKKYHCFINNGPNSLHGGKEGFMVKKFDVISHQKNAIKLQYFAKDMEEGYPGNLNLIIIYRLEQEKLYYEIEYVSDQKTIVNITNHSYFNLGDKDIFNHKLKIYSNQYAAVDKDGLSLDLIKDVNGTAFDFQKEKLIKDNFSFDDVDINIALGYDHNYLFENHNDYLRSELSFKKQKLIVSSNLPGMHLYSGNYLRNKHQGICFECQFFPNAINYNNYIKPIAEADVLYKYFICYELKGDKDESTTNN